MMWYCFFGFLLVFVDFSLALPNGGSINLLPGFLGYALLFVGALSLGHENERFRRMRLATVIAFVISALQFVLAIYAFKTAEFVLFVFATALSLYITYEFTEGAKMLERSRYKKLSTDKLSSAWIILCMTSILGFLVPFFPMIGLTQALVQLLALCWFEFSVYTLSRRLNGK